MMNWQSELQSAAERVMESPKTTALVSAYSTAAGLAALQQWITGLGSTLAVFAGLIGVLVLARLNWIKSENEKIRGRLLREKAHEMGVDLLDE
jgi:hypothetical protein